MPIQYQNHLNGICEENLSGFFIGWPNPPSNETFLRILQNSSAIWLAVDSETKKVVGFINAISDGILSAYIPLLEVLPDYQNSGIGKHLSTLMLETQKDLYMVDLTCDLPLQPFYQSFGMRPSTGMCLRNFQNQNGKPDSQTKGSK